MTSRAASGIQVLDDAAINDLVTPTVAADAMREAVVAAWRGDLVAPPRATVPVPEGTRMFFSVGLAGTEAWLLDAAVRSV